MINRAYHMASEAHRTQTRSSGESYINHPLAVAKIVAEIGLDEISLVAALLLFGSPSWPSRHLIPTMVATLVMGMSYTVYSEWLNTVVRKAWAYSELMPVVPLLGTGLSPLMQWLVVPTIGFAAIWLRCGRVNS